MGVPSQDMSSTNAVPTETCSSRATRLQWRRLTRKQRAGMTSWGSKKASGVVRSARRTVAGEPEAMCGSSR